MSGPPARSEGLIKTLVWPNIESAIDVDTLTTQGLWLCWFVGLVGFIVVAMQGHLWIGLLSGVFYFLGGIGIRRADLPAALLVWLIYVLTGGITALAAHTFPGILWVILVCLLTANVRGIWLASRWRGTEAAEPPPDMDFTLTDKLVNRMPKALWPVARWIFFPLAAVLLLLIALSVYQLTRIRHAQPFGTVSAIQRLTPNT